MHAVTARTELQPRGFHGWALKVACRLDGAHPVLAHICQTGSLKRQAIFAVLSELARDSQETLADRMRAVIPQPVTYTDVPLAVIARALVVARPSALLKSLFGSVPNGLLGVMRRLGDNPFRDPQSYRALHELMAYPAHRQRAKVLLQIGGSSERDHGPDRPRDRPDLGQGRSRAASADDGADARVSASGEAHPVSLPRGLLRGPEPILRKAGGKSKRLNLGTALD
jgi:hypothetical protein